MVAQAVIPGAMPAVCVQGFTRAKNLQSSIAILYVQWGWKKTDKQIVVFNYF